MDLLLADEPLEIVTPRILICDDSEMGRGLLKRMVMRRGYLAEEAEDGAAAIEAVAQSRPDLVLLDLGLPDLDGSEVLAQLRADHDADALPIIMVSAERDGEIVAACLALGASDYVTKPIHGAILYARIATHLDLHFARAFQPSAVRPGLRLVH